MCDVSVYTAEAGPVDDEAGAIVEEAESHALAGELLIALLFGEVEDGGEIASPVFEFAVEDGDFGLDRGPGGCHDAGAVEVREDLLGEHAEVSVVEEIEGYTWLGSIEGVGTGLL